MIEEYLDDYDKGEELGFVSGHAGNAVEMDFTEASEFLSDFIINHAEICLPLNESLSYDYDIYRPADEVTAIFENEMGDRFDILDNRQFYFDNSLQMDPTNMQRQYCLNITLHLQNIVQGNLPSKITLLASDVERGICDIQEPYKAILNGRTDDEAPARLIVYYTEPE